MYHSHAFTILQCTNKDIINKLSVITYFSKVSCDSCQPNSTSHKDI